ncbi:MAG: CopG family transcriptional regulator [Cyanobacteria bacterium J06581_3]
MSNYLLELPPELLAEAQKLATDNQMPFSQWVIAAISAKIEAEKTRQLFSIYAQKADDAKFDDILARVPDVPPIEGDELLP